MESIERTAESVLTLIAGLLSPVVTVSVRLARPVQCSSTRARRACR
jgi:hypothetical protein